MAAAACFSFPRLSTTVPPTRYHLPALPSPIQSHLSVRTQAMASDMLGDFGARDPFPEEIESRFGDKVLGYGDSEHKILIPTSSALSLADLDCSSVPHLQAPMSREDATPLLRKVSGTTTFFTLLIFQFQMRNPSFISSIHFCWEIHVLGVFFAQLWRRYKELNRRMLNFEMFVHSNWFRKYLRTTWLVLL